MLPKIQRKVSLLIFIAMIFLSVLTIFPRFTEGLPLGVDSPSHLFKVLYLHKTLVSYGEFPSWCSEWYGGTPFLHFYPPLAYVLTLFVALLGLGPLIAYKIVEAFFYIITPISIYLLSRELGFNRFQGLFAGFSFSVTPIVIENFIFYDRFTTIISAPLLCLFLTTYLKTLKSKKLFILIISGLLLTAIILIHHLSAYYLGIVVLLLLVSYYLKDKDLKGSLKKIVFTTSTSLLLSAFWWIPFLSSVFSIDNPFYNRSMVDNFITPGMFLSIILSMGLFQLLFVALEITLHMFPSFRNTKGLTGILKLLFPSMTIVVGSILSYWFIEVGQFLIVLGFITFLISFFARMKGREGKEYNFIFCVLWFLVFLWLGLGDYALLTRVLPFSKKLDVLRFTFYSAIPLSILAGSFFERILSKSFSNGFFLGKANLGKKSKSTILALCFVFIMFTNLYLAKDTSNLTTYRNFTSHEAYIPQEIVDFFKSAPNFARILGIRCPDWLYVLPSYAEKPIIDGWYPQEKILQPLLRVNDYQINTLNMYNTDERVKIWFNLISNASKLGINWIMIGEPKLNWIMDKYPNFELVQSIENLTIYESKTPILLVEVDTNEAYTLAINYSSPNKITLRINNVNEKVDIIVKEANFIGWKVFVNDFPINHSQNEDGFIKFQLEASPINVIRISYEKPDGFPKLISLLTLFLIIILLFAEHYQGSKSLWKKRPENIRSAPKDSITNG